MTISSMYDRRLFCGLSPVAKDQRRYLNNYKQADNLSRAGRMNEQEERNEEATPQDIANQVQREHRTQRTARALFEEQLDLGPNESLTFRPPPSLITRRDSTYRHR